MTAATERFWTKVDKRGHDECWEWQASRNALGYGRFTPTHGTTVGAHRFAWEDANRRPIPDGLIVLHACDNPPCVNPAHLSIGTYRENARQCVERGRHPEASKTACDNGHDLGPENTGRDRGARCCRTCKRDTLRRLRREGRTGPRPPAKRIPCPECGEVGWENNLARHRSKHARFTITPKEDR